MDEKEVKERFGNSDDGHQDLSRHICMELQKFVSCSLFSFFRFMLTSFSSHFFLFLLMVPIRRFKKQSLVITTVPRNIGIHLFTLSHCLLPSSRLPCLACFFALLVV
jgi:hypothetical protein